jgi:hypothetical protein
MKEKYKNICETGNAFEDNLLLIIENLEEKILKQKSIVKDKLKEITEEYQKLEKRNLDTANIIAHQYNSMRNILEELIEEMEE